MVHCCTPENIFQGHCYSDIKSTTFHYKTFICTINGQTLEKSATTSNKTQIEKNITFETLSSVTLSRQVMSFLLLFCRRKSQLLHTRLRKEREPLKVHLHSRSIMGGPDCT